MSELQAVNADADADADADAPPRVKQRTRLSAARRAIAKNMVRSKQEIPHFHVSVDVDMSQVLRRREIWKATGQPGVSVNDFFIWASGRALQLCPVLNSRLEDDTVVTFEDINVGLVASLGDRVIVPVVRHADTLDVREVSLRSRQLLQLAKERKLMPAQSEGGTFSVSNLGMFGVDSFVAIINPGQAAILAVGRVAQRAVVRDGAVVVRPVVTITLSVDHRVADGVVGAQFLSAVKQLLEGVD